MSNDTSKRPTTDQTAYQQLYDQHHDRLLSRVTGWVHDKDRAEDITAAAFRTAWAKREQFRGESALSTWLHAIAFNEARELWRQERTERLKSIEPPDENERALSTPDHLFEALEGAELRARVWEALRRIPAECRRLLIDRYVRGRSVQEIARRDRVPIGTVGSRIFTAKRLLREAWPTTLPVGGNMPEEKVRQIADEALKRLAEELQAGRSDALKNYLAAMSRFHRYSWGNVLLISSQRPTATHVAGYHAWRDLGRSVKRGEKGIMIYAPVRTRASDPEKPRAVARMPAPEKPSVPSETPAPPTPRLTGFRAAYVFDVDQTEGKPLPAFATTQGDPKDYGDKLKAIVAERGITLEYDRSIAPADGVSSGGQIRLRPGLSPAEEFSVLAHELAHEMIHHHKDTTQLTLRMRESQAEAVSFVICRAVGLETNTAAADYIHLYNGNEKTLAESLATIQETSSRILNDLLSEDRLRTLPTAGSGTEPAKTSPQPDRERSEPEPPSRPGPDPVDSVSWDR